MMELNELSAYLPQASLTSSVHVYLDIVIQRFISSKTTMPVPRIHDWSIDPHNILSRPYVIMDFMPGTNLSKLWNDKNWIRRQAGKNIRLIVEWMTELAALESDQIGRLDWDSTSGMHRIVLFQTVRL